MLTAKGERTRSRILDATASLVVARGVTNTSLDDILAATDTSKSQLFHYFPGGKDELLGTVEAREAARIVDDQRPYLDQLDSWEAWDAWADCVKVMYRRKLEGCPVASLGGRNGGDGRTSDTTGAGDAGDDSVEPSIVLYRTWLGALQTGVIAMQNGGYIRADANAEQLAMATLATVQGGAGMMQTAQSFVPLDVAVDAAIAYLRTFETVDD